MKKYAWIYIRVSKKDQSLGSASSLDMQELKCREWCNNNGYEVLKVYCDVESGGSDEREQFNQLMSAIPSKTADIVVFYEVSRIARKVSTGAKFFEELEKHNIPFHNIMYPEIKDLTMLNNLLSYARLERQMLSNRLKSTFRQRTLQGLRAAGSAPLGYRVEKYKLFIIEEEAELVKSIFKTFLDNLSISKTSKMYNKSRKALRYLLRNKTYLGMLVYNKYSKSLYGVVTESQGEYIEGTHEPIIDVETFNKVQFILDNSIAMRANKSKHDDELLFTSLLKCRCGGSMYRNIIGYNCQGEKKISMIYMCGDCGKSISKKRSESMLLEAVSNLEIINAMHKTKNAEKDLEKIKRKLINLAKERERVISMYQKGFINDSELEKKINDLKKEKEEFELKINGNRKVETSTIDISNLEKLKFVIENIELLEDKTELKKMIKLLIKKIEVQSFKPFTFNIILH